MPADFLYVPHDAPLADGSVRRFDGRGVVMADVTTDTETTATNCTKTFEQFTKAQLAALPGRPPVPVTGIRLKVVHSGAAADALVYIPVGPNVPAWQFEHVEVCFWCDTGALVTSSDHHPNVIVMSLMADATGAENNGASADFQMRARSGWNVLRFHRDHFDSVFGTFDWGSSTIKRLKMVIKQANGGGGPFTCHFGYIAFRRKSKAVFVHTFDDLVQTQYTLAYPELASRGFKGTLAVPTQALDATYHASGAPSGTLPSISEQHMSREQWSGLTAIGWDMVNHTRGHTSMSGLSVADATEAVRAGAADLRALDPTGSFTRPDLLVWVGGVVSANAFTAAANLGVKWGFKTSQEAYPNNEGHWCKHRYYRERFDMTVEKGATAIETALQRVSQAVEMGTPLITMWHKFTTGASGAGLPDTVTNSVTWLQDMLNTQKAYIDSGDAVTMTLPQYYDALDAWHRTGGNTVA